MTIRAFRHNLFLALDCNPLDITVLATGGYLLVLKNMPSRPKNSDNKIIMSQHIIEWVSAISSSMNCC